MTDNSRLGTNSSALLRDQTLGMKGTTSGMSEVIWGVYNPRCGFYFHGFSDTRRTAQEVHLATLGYQFTWKELYADGDRLVRVRVTPVHRVQRRQHVEEG